MFVGASVRDGRMVLMTECPPDEVLAAYVDNALSVPEREELECHLGDCEQCRKTLAIAIKSRSVPSARR
jgi:anti-sigma factor RsiW